MTRRADLCGSAWKWLFSTSVATVLLLGGAVPAAADMEESTQASLLVLQSISLIANDAAPATILERLSDALDAPDQKGVDRAKVVQAVALITSGGSGLAQGRELLVSAIAVRAATGYGTIPVPGEVGQDVPPYATGAEPGTVVVLDKVQPARGVGGRSDLVVLLAGVGMVVTGLYLSRRWKPTLSIHQLERLSRDAGAGASA